MQTICLPTPGLQFRGKLATAVGFGMFGFNSTQSTIKRYVELRVDHRTYWNKKIFGTYVRPTDFPRLTKDPCAGDSGRYTAQLRVIIWGVAKVAEQIKTKN